ncbi:unnamed protein product [Ilex paraguariensis]|uniref:WRKY domain-containing protein n=1 Tax=Ilex paraguariensis TaxID=185542 RepID=A0ABC8RV42_9AQUA
MEDSHSDSVSRSQEVQSTRSELRPHSSNGENRGIYGHERVRDANSEAADYIGNGSINGAKYRLMSPAKLPISRSPCITMPAGLSPTSFLESPVLLSNIKAEPSPTTGSFSKPQLMQGFGGTAAFSSTTNCSTSNTFDERKSSSFEFKFQTGFNYVSGLSSTGPATSAGFNQQQSESPEYVQDQCQTRSFASSPLVKGELAASSEDFSLSAPVNMLTSGVAVPAGIDSEELSQRGHNTIGIQASQPDHKDTGPSVTVERSSDDGYNWRKYGQKLVKGCEFPRSYYKCTYPNCEVKKIFERSYDGQITKIVYKGTHDHPKPQPSRRFTAGALMSIQEEKSDKVSSLTDQEDKSTVNAHTCDVEPNGTHVLSPRQANDDSVEGAASQFNSVNDEVDEDDPFSKRRKIDVGGVDLTSVVKPIREPRVVVQTVSEVDILDDGYRWRKYGQKVVRGNPNPRSYYKCTNAGCPVRKHVERASHDPKAVITTYEGKHNHDVPSARTSSHDIAGLTAGNGVPRIRSVENDTISLDLGVGISCGAENGTNEQQQTLDAVPLQSQVHVTTSNSNIVQASPFTAFYGATNGSMNLYGSRENRIEGHSFGSPPLHHSSGQYPQNLGRILLGP